MKTKISATILSIAFLSFLACDKKSTTTTIDEVENITENITIRGASLITGDMPVPNNGIQLSLPEVSENAFLDAGFEIPISTNADVSGAYIRFINDKNKAATSYYDVDLEANENTGKSSSFNSPRLFKKSKNTKTAKGTEFRLNLGFTPQFDAETFCYEICVYDDQGNISAPQTVCITVKEWGGSTALLGQWNFMYYEDFYEGSTTIEEAGIEYCDSFGCYITDYGFLIFNADGTFAYESKYSRKEVNSTVYDSFDTYESAGNWSYDNASNLLTLVEYFAKNTDENGVNYEELLPILDADIYQVIAIISGNELQIISDEYDDDGDGIIDERYKEFYGR